MDVGRDTVVVVTGASSGIGRATAHAFAARGASVVLAARDIDALEEAARECKQRGARAVPLPTDVTDEVAVELLARRAERDFGRIDVWVNCAGVALYGRFWETPAADWRRVIETNLFGYVNGSRAALDRFRAQGFGVLVNVSSVTAETGQAMASAYAASKSAIDGLSRSLREDLAHDPGIHVCTVYPGSVDTQLFANGANYSGRRPRALHPVQSPEQNAEAIVRCVERPRREAYVGAETLIGVAAHRLLGVWIEPATSWVVERLHFAEEPASETEGSLYEPKRDALTGGWRRERPRGGVLAAWGLGAAGALVLAALGLRAARGR